MRKITSFLSLVMLCCISVFAQETVTTGLPQNKLVKLGTAQAEMIPGQWYFLQNPRNGQNNDHSYFALPGEGPKRGGLVEDRTSAIGLSTQEVMENATGEDGVSSEEYKKRMVRFVAVEGQEGAFCIQFGTGTWFGDGDPLNTATVSEVKYQAGLAGKWNFYLVKNADGEPNTAGRFAWNYYDMKNRVDNNGVGNSVNFWNSGELTLSALDWNQVADQGDAGIIGNNIWQIYDIQVLGDLDDDFLWNEAFEGLLDNFTTVSSYTVSSGELFVISLANGENVGNAPGNYRPELVEPFLALHNQVSNLMDLAETDGIEAVQELYPDPAALDTLNAHYVKAYNTMVQNKVPRAMSGIKPGYYTINSSLYWYETVQDTTFYTQEEADEANAEAGVEEGEDGYVTVGDVKEIKNVQVPARIKSLMAESSVTSDGTPGQWMAYAPLAPEAKFLWKIDTVPGKPTEYRLETMLNGKTFVGISQSTINGQLVYNDTATVCFDFRNDKEAIKYRNAEGEEVNDTVVSFNIRSSKHSQDSYNYLHCNGHSSGAGTQNWCVGWADGGATRWYLAPVDEATADAWINGPDAQVKKMVEKGDSIANAFPAELTIAKDKVADVNWDVPVANVDNFESPFTCTSEGSVAQLFDGEWSISNFWHSEWNSGSTNAYSMTNGTNYFVVHDTEGLIEGGLAVEVARRAAANDHVAELTVYGTNDDYILDDALAALKTDVTNDGYTWTKLGVLSTPFGSNTEQIVSNAIEFEGKYKTYKFVATHTVGSNYTDRGYFHMGEFQLYPATISKRYETVQYDVRKAEADAAAAAVDAWVAAGFSADSVELYEDEAFLANYNGLLSAYAAWQNVYVNPGALRTSIYNAPAEDLFVVGTNPGQWSADVATPASVVAAAKAYDASGAYTTAESEAHIKAIADVLAVVYDQANPVEEGKWYRIKFATEEMYETYGWDKVAGAPVVSHEITTSTGLFGKTVAAGNSVKTYVSYENEDGTSGQVTVYDVEEAEEYFEGQKLMFFEDELTNDADLFRFIAVSDSTYMIQNKATGLYIRATWPASLSAIPSVYEQFAVGAGGNVLRAYNVMGGEDNGYNYLHAQVADMAMVSWDEASVGSRSMFLIEEVEEVTETPSNEYVQKLWPGQLNAMAMPVDVTVGDGATAYGAVLNVTEEDTTVVLMSIEAETIKAGTPFILVADADGEYVTYAERLAEMKASLKEELGDDYTSNDDLTAEAIVNSEYYAQIQMTHGEVIAAQEVDTLGHLVGAFKNTALAAGKAIQAKENGFVHTLASSTIAAYKSWIKADFDGDSEDVLKGIQIKIEGSIEDGINEVLNNVAKGGDIYTVGGQLVGKGNINTVNNLPAGIYVVNGVKVIKK